MRPWAFWEASSPSCRLRKPGMPKVPTGDLALFYREIGEGAPVLLIPGLGSDHTAWGQLSLALQVRYRCISVDNRDVGRSDRAAGAYTIRDMARDTAGLMDALDLSSAHVIGWSMGGAIAQELALEQPDRVQSLALVATYHEGDGRADQRFGAMAEVRRTMGRETYLRLAYPWSFTFRAYQQPDFIESLQRQALSSQFPQEQDAFERQMEATLRHNTRGRLEGIRCPTLVVVGEEDILTPLERFARPMTQEIRGAQLSVIPQAGHGLLWEQPEATIQAITQFLDQT